MTWFTCMYPASQKVQEACARVYLGALDNRRVKTLRWGDEQDNRPKFRSMPKPQRPRPQSNISFALSDGNDKRDQALRMAHQGHRSTAEIASALGLNPRTVRGYIYDSSRKRNPSRKKTDEAAKT